MVFDLIFLYYKLISLENKKYYIKLFWFFRMDIVIKCYLEIFIVIGKKSVIVFFLSIDLNDRFYYLVILVIIVDFNFF